MFLCKRWKQTDLLTKKQTNIFSEVRVKHNTAIQLSQELVQVNVNYLFVPPILSLNKVTYLPLHDQNLHQVA